MAIQVDAVYEAGVLRLEQPVPLTEKQRVRVTIESGQTRAERLYGMLGWKGDPKIIDEVCTNPEFEILESP